MVWLVNAALAVLVLFIVGRPFRKPSETSEEETKAEAGGESGPGR